MKKIVFVAIMAAVALVSCQKDHVCQLIPVDHGYPTYLSMGRDKLVVEVDRSKIIQEVRIPMITRLENGRDEFGFLEYVFVEVDQKKSTAVAGVHYLIDSLITEKIVDNKQVLDTVYRMRTGSSNGFNFISFAILPKNITNDVKLNICMTTRYGDPAIKETEIDLVLP